MEPGAARRAVLVALQSVAPYCLARWAPATRDEEEDGAAGWLDDSLAASPTAASSADGSGLPLLPHQRLLQQVALPVDMMAPSAASLLHNVHETETMCMR